MTTKEEKELFEFFSIKVDKGQSPVRIDKFLMDKMERVSRNRIQYAARAEYIFVNDIPVKSNYKVQPADHIIVKLPFQRGGGDNVTPENIPLDIVYEDDHIIVLNKPAGLVVHPGIGNYSGTLVNALTYYLNNIELPIKEGNEADRPGIVHRIDKDTTGLMVIAKSSEAMTGLSVQFEKHTIERTYLALVWGNFEDHKGTITGYIARHPNARLQMHVFDNPDEGKHSVTHYEVLEDLYYVSLVKCNLETGRTHQIRVHMYSQGHPLFNDWRYNGDRIWKGTVYSKYKKFVDNCFDILPRQALHAFSLGFEHPATGEHMYFEQELPTDFQEVVEKWRNYVSSRKNNT